MSIFGGASKPQSLFANTASSSLFGASQPQNSSPFGAAANSQQAPPTFTNPFGASSQTQQSGGFGSTSQAPPKPQFNLSPLQTAPATTQPQSDTLFGGTTNNQSGTSAFGGAAQTSTPATSPFGATTAQTTQSGFGGLGQGQTNTQSSGFGGLGLGQSTTNNQTSGFGGLGLGQSTTNNQSSGFGGLGLGQSQTNNQSSGFGGLGQNQSSSNMFGSALKPPTLSLNPPQTSNPQFGATTTQQPSLFPNSNAPQQSNLFGSTQRPGLLQLGQSTTQVQQQAVPGVKIDISQIRGTTRFNDLHEELQKQITQMDEFIQRQITFKEQCDAMTPAHAASLATIPSDVSYIQARLSAAESALDNDSASISAVKSVVASDADAARISFRAVENLKLPPQFHYNGIWPAAARGGANTGGSRAHHEAESVGAPDLVGYFSSEAEGFAKTLQSFKDNVDAIEAHLATVEASIVAQGQQLMFKRGRDGGGRSRDEQVRELSAVLMEFERGILAVAGKVGAVREEAGVVMEGR